MNDDLLSVSGLNTHYGRAHILFDVALAVRRGEVLALLGRNGAGKSTTLKSIMGLVRPSSGRIDFAGRRIEREPTYRVARLGLGYVPEDRRIFTELTVFENLVVALRPARAGVPHWTYQRIFDIFPNLATARRRPAGQISGGEQQMLAVARALMANPACVLLDEPSEGLAPLIVEQLAQTIKLLKSEGLTVVLSEQNIHFAGYVADHAIIIEKGRVAYAGRMAELAGDSELQHEYLTA